MAMILIRFPDEVAKQKALGFLLGRFSLKSWATGEMIVPDFALPGMAVEGISFFVQGPTNDRLASASDE